MTSPTLRRRLICIVTRFSFGAILLNIVLSSLIFLISAYAFLLRTKKFDLIKFSIENPQSSSSNFEIDRYYVTGDDLFCVLPNAIRADFSEKFDPEDDLTLVTQSSLHYLNEAVEQSRFWDGPISYALYIPTWTLVKNLHFTLLALRRCSIEFRRKVSIHFFYPKKSVLCPIQNVNPSFLLNFTDCQLSIENLLRKLIPRYEKTKSYPPNTARNIARRASTTILTLVADVELMPNPNFTSMFREFYRNRHRKRRQEAFVVPVFELDYSRRLPKTKEELYEDARNELALPFHSKRIAYECHRIPFMGKWWHAGSMNRSRLDIFVTTLWIRPCWEPVFLSVSDETPFYDERFIGYGKNKIQQVYEMCRSNFTFHILDNAFFIHRNISILSENEWNEISRNVIRNNELFEKFRRELDQRYTDPRQVQYCDTNLALGTSFVKQL